MTSTDASFRKITVMSDAIYKIADWTDLCRDYAAQQDVADALERIVQVFVQELTALRAEHGDGS